MRKEKREKRKEKREKGMREIERLDARLTCAAPAATRELVIGACPKCA
jgi:hypothetical protein